MRRLGETNYSHLLGGFACWSIYLGLVRKHSRRSARYIIWTTKIFSENNSWARATDTTLTSESDNLTWLRTETQHPSRQGISSKERGCRGGLVPKNAYWLNLRGIGLESGTKRGRASSPVSVTIPWPVVVPQSIGFSLHTFKLPCGPLPIQSWALLSGSQ